MYLVEFIYPCGKYAKGDQVVLSEEAYLFVKLFVTVIRTYNKISIVTK